ncbi:hypothetical protein X768_01815 [Mesorhizobium sp. LSJC265A00]|nr:hypothetical protein X768_01815 [Mesorhizobium sp. LSJC265A00]
MDCSPIKWGVVIQIPSILRLIYTGFDASFDVHLAVLHFDGKMGMFLFGRVLPRAGHLIAHLTNDYARSILISMWSF